MKYDVTREVIGMAFSCVGGGCIGASVVSANLLMFAIGVVLIIVGGKIWGAI